MKRDVKRKRYNDIRAFKMTLRSVWIAAMRGYKPCACVGVALYNISSGKTLKRKTKKVFTDIVTALWNSLSRQYREKENEIRRINHSKHTVSKCNRGWTGGFREDKTKVGQGENREGIKHHVWEEKKKEKRNQLTRTRGQVGFTARMFVDSLVVQRQVTEQRWMLNISFLYKPAAKDEALNHSCLTELTSPNLEFRTTIKQQQQSSSSVITSV